MGRKTKLNKDLKVKACEEYKNSKGSFASIAKAYNVSKEAFRRWYYSYQEHGADAFNISKKNRSYSKEFKAEIVQKYLDGSYSLADLHVKYKISIRTISIWVQNYYNGIENKDYDPKGEVYTMKSRKTTFEERLDIVKWVIANDMNYKEAADKNAVRYALIYQWVQKYLKNGEEGLKYRKRGPQGKAKIDENTLSETERLKLELEREKALRERAEFRLELFKKKEEFAQKRRSRK